MESSTYRQTFPDPKNGRLQTVHRALLPAANVVTSGHVSLLKHKMLTALMKRLDASLFERLLAGTIQITSV